MYFCTDADNTTTDDATSPGRQLQEPAEHPPADDHIPVPSANDKPPETHFEERRYPVRERRSVNRFGVNDIYESEDLHDFEYINNLNIFSTVLTIPNTYLQAITSPEKDNWVRAMAEEIASLHANNTYQLVQPPPGIKPVGGRWIYNVKNDPSGAQVFKARWVAKGFSQKVGIDYDQTYAPTAHMPSIRMLIQIAVQYGLLVHQMDVNNAYLNSDINREIYMVQPTGFINNSKLVCKLNKSLYGLKQSAHLWNNTLNAFLISEQLTASVNDPCVYMRKTSEGII